MLSATLATKRICATIHIVANVVGDVCYNMMGGGRAPGRITLYLVSSRLKLEIKVEP